MRALLTAALVLVVGLGIFSAASAARYDAEVTATKSTTAANTWIYTVRNAGTEPFFVLQVFNIQVDDQTDVLSTVTPGGWSVDTESQPHFITWTFDTSGTDGTGGLQAGVAQAGFQATFSGTPVAQEYSVSLYNGQSGECPSLDGTVSTPEPGGMALLLTGFAPLAALALRRRIRR